MTAILRKMKSMTELESMREQWDGHEGDADKLIDELFFALYVAQKRFSVIERIIFTEPHDVNCWSVRRKDQSACTCWKSAIIRALLNLPEDW